MSVDHTSPRSFLLILLVPLPVLLLFLLHLLGSLLLHFLLFFSFLFDVLLHSLLDVDLVVDEPGADADHDGSDEVGGEAVEEESVDSERLGKVLPDGIQDVHKIMIIRVNKF